MYESRDVHIYLIEDGLSNLLQIVIERCGQRIAFNKYFYQHGVMSYSMIWKLGGISFLNSNLHVKLLQARKKEEDRVKTEIFFNFYYQLKSHKSLSFFFSFILD